VSLAPRKLPRQSRSHATVEAILEATIRVLLSRGYQGTTTTAVAERAGVSVGSLYQYFPNKDSLIAALVQRHSSEAIYCVDLVLKTSRQDDVEESMRAIARAAIAAHRIHPALHKILVEQVPRIGQIKSAMNTSRIVTRKLSKWLEEREQFQVLQLERTAFVIETVVEALTHRIIVDKAQDISDRDLEQQATQLLVACIEPQVRIRAPLPTRVVAAR
jgi:AcrR family transcriptional regulator